MKKRFIYNGKETNYEVSSDGKVFNIKTGKELKGTLARNEYKTVQLSIEGQPKSFMVHRLVAQLFCENPENYNIVDHIDRDKYNNDYRNLRWVSNSTNIKNRESARAKAPEKYCNNTEDFTPIYDTHYGINKEGQIINFETERYLKGFERNGYKRIFIDKRTYSVHRLVWETFKGKIPEGFFIDHIDGNRSNNNLSNLRMVSQSKNMENAYSKNHKSKKSIMQYDSNGKLLQTFSSLVEAANSLDQKVSPVAISGAAKRRGSCAGFYWIFADEAEKLDIKDIVEKNRSRITNIVLKYDLDGNLIATYHSQAEAARENGMSKGVIGRRIRSHQPYENHYYILKSEQDIIKTIIKQ